MNANRRSSASERGFSLIELLMVCAIMVLVSAVVLVNQNKYGGTTLLQSFAYDAALTVRQAQVYGVSVKASTCASATQFVSYGVHFDSTSGNNKQYILFADCNGDGVYESGTDYLANTFTITRNYSIKDLCVTNSGAEVCGQHVVDMMFQRPEPDAKISWTDSSGNQQACLNGGVCADAARVIMRSPQGDTRSIIVENNGQISVSSS